MWFGRAPKLTKSIVMKATTPTIYAAIEHDIKYVPDARIRYGSVDADYMAFDKLDLTAVLPYS